MTERDESDDGAQSAPIAADRTSGDAAAHPQRTPDAADPPPAAGERPDTSPDDTSTEDRPVEIGGQKGPEPTRYGDWEGRGRCTDF